MSISSVSSGTSASSAGMAQQIQQIQKQIQGLEKDITKENASTDNAKTKEQLDQEYQLEIEALQAQIQQIQQQATEQAVAKTTSTTGASSNQSASQSATPLQQDGVKGIILNTTA